MGVEEMPIDKKSERVRHALEKAMALFKESGRNVWISISDDPRGEWATKIKVAHIIDGRVISPDGRNFPFEEIENVFLDDKVIE